MLAGAVKQIRAQHPNTVFAAAGDLIGASTFESFIAHDKPTLDALNEAGLEVSAVGNHEFDQGYDDLVNRVMAPDVATTNPDGGAEWKYIGANVKMRRHRRRRARPRRSSRTSAPCRSASSARSPSTSPSSSPRAGSRTSRSPTSSTAVNAEADALKAEGVDVVVLLVHEGAPNTDCDTIGPTTRPRTSARSSTGVERQRRRDHLRPHPPRLQLHSSRSPGWADRAVTDASRGLRRPVRLQPQPAHLLGRPEHRAPTVGRTPA